MSVFSNFLNRVSIRSNKKTINYVFTLLAYLVIPNIPYMLWLDPLSPSRAVINVDYLILGIISPVFIPVVMIISFVFLAVVDAFVFVSTMYHFAPRELALSMRYVQYNPVGIGDLPLGAIALTALSITVAIVLALRLRNSNNRRGPHILGATLLVIVVADVANGTNTFAPFTLLPFYSRTQHVAVNPADSALLIADFGAFLPIGHKPVMQTVESAMQQGLHQWPGQATGTNVALILVESWGQIDSDPAFTRAIVTPLLSRNIAARYTVTMGSVPFHGSTTNAELRELCGVRGNYRDLFTLPRRRCVPDTFQGMGYQVTGMHGFFGDMFDRTSWWPRIGIRHALFLDSFRRTGVVRRCGTAFPGVCDADLIGAMGDQLGKPRQFVYGLTINSHLPLPPTRDFDGALRCSELPVPLKNEPCALAQHWHTVFAAVARTAMRSDIAPTQFIIVGDHSPPLMGRADRMFSSSRVPYVVLTPRVGGAGEGRAGIH